jgi:sodium/bile acid cotransporter 7
MRYESEDGNGNLKVLRRLRIRKNGFIVALLGAVTLAFLLPGPGARGGCLHADILNDIGVALILFLQGLSMAIERMRAGAGNWRLHIIVQSFTFLIFPVLGLLNRPHS